MKQSSEETPRKESTKRKISLQNKASTTGVWPCRIDGCNKQFAREADLKRHQRTTKVHSTPGFACPQCDATFTRTDALRRHQKSRHNGVIIETTESRLEEPDESRAPSTPKSRSRSLTPSGKYSLLNLLNASSPSSQPGPSPPSSGPSYYRQHTTSTSPYPSNTRYASNVGLPTSAARLHQAHWPPPPPWEGTPQGAPPLSPIPGESPPYDQSPYYRRNGSPGSHPRQINSDLTSRSRIVHDRSFSEEQPRTKHSRATTPVRGSEQRSEDIHSQSQSPVDSGCVGPVIDPSLDDNTAARSSEVSIEVTKAAMQALIESSSGSSSTTSSQTSSSPVGAESTRKPSQSMTPSIPEVDMDIQMGDQESDKSAGLGKNNVTDDTHLERPPPMEQMLTEDGEPMLNPAELLTVESLASPPP